MLFRGVWSRGQSRSYSRPAPLTKPSVDRQEEPSQNVHCSLAYSALALFRMGMSGSASFQSANRSTTPSSTQVSICSSSINARLTIRSTMFSVMRASERSNHWNAIARGNFCPAFSSANWIAFFERRRNKGREFFTIHWISNRNQLTNDILAILTCLNCRKQASPTTRGSRHC
jgi:hypothetical protein